MRLEAAVVVILALLVPPAAALVAPPPTVDFDMNRFPVVSAIDFNTFPPPPGFGPSVVTTRSQNPDGSVDLTVDAGKVSVVNFGPSLDQSFVGQIVMHGFARAGTGFVRVFASAAASSLPLEYAAPSPGALGANLYESYAEIAVSAAFWDVVVPPPTAGKPVGSPTSLSLEPHFDCTVDGDYGRGSDQGVGFTATTEFFRDEAAAAMESAFAVVGLSDQGGCNTYLDRVVGGFTVGTPVLVRFEVVIGVQALAGNRPYSLDDQVAGSEFAVLDGLNTGYMIIKDADGNEVVGASGVHYGAKPVLSELTTTTTTTTTTTFVPPTTLPGCDPSAYCGDGIYQPECGEACDCPLLAGGQVATICTADVSLPPLGSACALCAGCQVDDSPCAVTTTTESTTTSTRPGNTTSTTAPVGTTTTIATGTTTTSTIPSGDPCIGLTSFVGLRCVCEQGITPAACATDHVSPVVPRLFHKACGSVAHAATLTGHTKTKKVKALVHGAVGTLERALATIGKAAKKHKLTAPCSAAVSHVLGDAQQRAREIGSSQ
jgi:hypothetical protein